MANILITGASTGIGRAIALALAKRGDTAWAGVRNPKSIEELTKLHADGLKPILLDVEKPDTVRSAYARILKEAGTLHGLVNNAGLAVGGPVEGLDVDDWRRQFEVNVFGLVDVTKTFLPALRESKGRVVNISSIAGKLAAPFLGPYAASKYAVEALSDSLRREVASFGVKVAIVEPGAIRTPLWKKSASAGADLRKRMTPEIEMLYGDALDKFMGEVENQGANGDPVHVVVDAVLHALSAKRPKTRYPVGRFIGVATALTGVVPDLVFDKIIQARIR